MTTDSPKGPEREARPDLSQTVFEALWKTFEEEGGRLAPGTADRLTEAALRPISSELERLTAEVERLTGIARAAEYVEGPADCFEQECDDFTNEAGELVELPANRCSHMTVRYATADDADAAKWCPEMIRSLEAEVSRLREQLAAQPQLPATAVDDLVEFWHNNKHEGFLDDAARAVIAKWGASSSEVEAPQPHEVRMIPCADRTHAKCRTCLAFRCGTQEEAEDWKDQHEADTLRPALAEVPSGGTIINVPGLTEKQEDALVDRIAELTEVMTERIRSAMPVSQHMDGETGESFWTVQVSHAAKVAARVIAQLELPQKDEGRPSGSERLAPRSEFDYSALRNTKSDEHPAAIAQSAWVDVQHRDNVGGEHRRGFCRACVTALQEAYCLFPHNLWAGTGPQDAAQAARSEATPKWVCVGESHDADLGEPCSNCKPYESSPIGKLMDHIGASPSLRKEGEDTADDNDAIEFTRSLGEAGRE